MRCATISTASTQTAARSELRMSYCYQKVTKEDLFDIFVRNCSFMSIITKIITKNLRTGGFSKGTWAWHVPARSTRAARRAVRRYIDGEHGCFPLFTIGFSHDDRIDDDGESSVWFRLCVFDSVHTVFFNDDNSAAYETSLRTDNTIINSTASDFVDR